MTTLELVIIMLSVISIIGAITMWIASWRASIKTELKKHVADFYGDAATLKSAQSSMRNEFNEQQRAIVTRIVWRSSRVPLVDILKIPEERYNIYQGLADPSKYPWEKEESEFIK